MYLLTYLHTYSMNNLWKKVAWCGKTDVGGVIKIFVSLETVVLVPSTTLTAQS